MFGDELHCLFGENHFLVPQKTVHTCPAQATYATISLISSHGYNFSQEKGKIDAVSLLLRHFLI